MGPLIPLFWTSGDVCPGFQNEGGGDPSLVCFLACAQWIPQVHLWCDACQSLGGHHGSRLCSLHACSSGMMPEFDRENSAQ